MNIEFKNNDFFTCQAQISPKTKIHFKIVDKIEGDINLKISIVLDTNNVKSHTSYHVIDLHSAEIRIVNPDFGKYTSPNKPILIGTYENEYRLFLEFVLEPQMTDRKSVIRLKFSIKRK